MAILIVAVFPSRLSRYTLEVDVEAERPRCRMQAGAIDKKSDAT